MTRRLTATVAVVGVAAAVPAIANLVAPRTAAAPVQVSLNVAVPAFELAGMVPGDVVTRCLRARNEGAEAIGLVDGAAITGDLAPYLRIVVERGSGLGDAGPSCQGFAPSGAYAYGTTGQGVAPNRLRPEYTTSWPAKAEKSLRVTIGLPADTPPAASAKQATATFAFAGYPIQRSGTTSPPLLPGGIAPGTTGGFDKDGNFLTNKQIKRQLRIGKARLLKNGNVRVTMHLPAGGAIRAKVILPNGVYYAHTLRPVEWGPKVRVLLKRRAVGKAATRKAKRLNRKLRVRVTTRYRWAHGPDAYVQPEQKLTIVKKKRR